MTTIRLKRFWEMLARQLTVCVSTDMRALFIVVVLAILLRIPAIGYPESTVFDEATYVSYAIHDVRGIPYFDIHPPLVRIIFAYMASKTDFTLDAIPMDIGQPFGDFPYVPIRTVVALAGVLLAVVVYCIMRALLFPPEVAIFPALFVVFDNALVAFSRLMLPDMFLLLASMLALLCAVILIKRPPRQRYLLGLCVAIFLGIAISVKWTGLGMVFIVLAWLFLSGERKVALMVSVIALLFYCLVFTVYFMRFTEGGTGVAILPPYNVEWITSTVYPKGGDMSAITAFLPEYHRTILRANSDEAVTQFLPSAPSPITWLIARSIHRAWVSADGTRAIVFSGNAVLSIFSFFILLFELGWCIFHFARRRIPPIGKNEMLLLVGFMANYLPFLFISRPMYLYHYFVALLFLFMLAPFVAPRLRACINTLAHDRHIGTVLITFACVLVVVYFFLGAAQTYGM